MLNAVWIIHHISHLESQLCWVNHHNAGGQPCDISIIWYHQASQIFRPTENKFLLESIFEKSSQDSVVLVWGMIPRTLPRMMKWFVAVYDYSRGRDWPNPRNCFRFRESLVISRSRAFTRPPIFPLIRLHLALVIWVSSGWVDRLAPRPFTLTSCLVRPGLASQKHVQECSLRHVRFVHFSWKGICHCLRLLSSDSSFYSR